VDRLAPPRGLASAAPAAATARPHGGGMSGQIGPNAITRVAEAMRASLGEQATAELFGSIQLQSYLARPPQAMVPQDEVGRLQARLRAAHGPELARRIGRDAGGRTGDYLLAHRIPRPAQFVLRCLPSAMAARILVRAIGRHAWTFAGSGTFSFSLARTDRSGPALRLSIESCPLCSRIRADAPACDYFAATFERIFTRLVSARTSVVETACQANGAPRCVFEVRWSGPSG
jgi:divinyl protochlorophyllide a 8-vinyl-reductase